MKLTSLIVKDGGEVAKVQKSSLTRMGREVKEAMIRY